MSGGNGSNGAPDEICYNLSTFAAPPPPDTRPAQGQGAIAPSPWRMSARMSLLSRPVAPSPRLDQLADAVGIVSLIGQHDGACAKVVEQAVDDLPIMRLTCGQAEPDREALRVDNDLDLGREPAARSTETMICTPPFCRRGLLVGANRGAAWRKAAGLSPKTSPTFNVWRSERRPASPADYSVDLCVGTG